VKFRRAQPDSNQSGIESDRLGIGIDMHSGTEEEAADRALSGVARKLDKSLSVEYTVNELITEATDIANLAQMFAGWSPHC
jgi:ataxia telangiectasia mutated family protein